jgi:hypothetical protein
MSFDIADFTGFDYDGDPATGQIVPNSPTSGDSPRVAFKYDLATRTYTLVTLDLVTQQERILLFSTPDNATDPNYTDTKFLGYSGTPAGLGADAVLRLYRSGSANPELKLSYSGFGQLATHAPMRHLNFSDYWFGYGIETKAADIPVSGAATYSGILYGFGVDEAAGKQYELEGTSSLVVNFATQKASGTVNVTLVSADGTRIAVGAATFSDATIGSLDGLQFPFGGALTGSGMPNGVMQAKLFGPGALETSGIFNVRIQIPSAGMITAHGAFAAAKQ